MQLLDKYSKDIGVECQHFGPHLLWVTDPFGLHGDNVEVKLNRVPARIPRVAAIIQRDSIILRSHMFHNSIATEPICAPTAGHTVILVAQGASIDSRYGHTFCGIVDSSTPRREGRP